MVVGRARGYKYSQERRVNGNNKNRSLWCDFRAEPLLAALLSNRVRNNIVIKVQQVSGFQATAFDPLIFSQQRS